MVAVEAEGEVCCGCSYCNEMVLGLLQERRERVRLCVVEKERGDEVVRLKRLYCDGSEVVVAVCVYSRKKSVIYQRD